MIINPQKGLSGILVFGLIYFGLMFGTSRLAMLLFGYIDTPFFSSGDLGLRNAAIYLFMSLAVGAILWFGKFLGSIHSIPIGQKAILVRLGERLREPVLDEGLYWTPPFCTPLLFDTKEQQLDISEMEILSSDSIPITIKGQFRIRVTEPFNYSDVTSPETTLLEQARDACRSHFSAQPALETASNATLSEHVQTRLSSIATQLGFGISQFALTTLRLPQDIEKLSQVLRLIRQQHPEISFRDALDALQSDRQNVRKLVLESSSLEAAVGRVIGILAQ